jgi:enamine deaminase RidA (YjgF/YER057c/UK114 family)
LVPEPVAEYAQGVEVEGGRTLYVAGQIAIDADGRLVGEGDIRAQTRQVFANIQAIVEEAGGEMSDIVKLVTFLTDIDDYAGFVESGCLKSKPPRSSSSMRGDGIPLGWTCATTLPTRQPDS